MMRRMLPVLLVLAALAPAAFAIPRPLNPTEAGARQPNLLSEYERDVLRREMVKLTQAVRAARLEASKDASLEPLRQAAAEAKLSGDRTNAMAAAKALADATETILYRDPEMPAKIKRLMEVGQLLEYDTRLRKEQRAHERPAVAPLPPPPPPASTNEVPSAAPSENP